MQQRTERILWGLACLIILVTVVLSRSDAMTRVTAPSVAAPPHVMMFDPEHFANAAEQIVANDPFRLERKPAGVAFGTPDVPVSPPPPVSRPFQSLVLKGVLGGPPWQAIFAGVPNRGNNVVARVGDTLAGLRITRVQRNGVVLKNRDTLLTLTLTRTWQ